MSSRDTPPDARISHYRILYPLGAGGMGEVYAAVDETLQRRVAVKAIRVEHRLDEGAQGRFLREARILSQLDHPNICRAYDYIRGDDHDWLVLELIDGESLRDRLKAGLDAATKMKAAEQIASVLVATHAANIVHRDLKPGNVMLTRGGEVKVLDFGLARADAGKAMVAPAAGILAALESMAVEAEITHSAAPPAPRTVATDSTFHTQHDSLTGTLAYMSPEQALGEAATAASDMFSYGLLLQEIFTGRRAYTPGLDALTLLNRVRAAEPDPPAGVTGDVADLIRALTARAPSQRPTAVDVAARLQWIREKPGRRLRWAAAIVLVLVAVAAAVKYTVDLRRERTVAVLAREDADRRRGQAEALIGFMVGDLRSKLTKAGRLELLEDVGGKAMAYFASVPTSSLSGEELSLRVQTVYQIGAVRQAQGDLKGATVAYRDSLSLAQQLAARDPSNADWQLRLAFAHFYLGDALRRQGDLDGALSNLTEYRTIAERLVARDASNASWQLELSYANGGVAAIQEAKGDLAGARKGLELALALKDSLLTRDPQNVARRRDVGTAHNRLGVVLEKIGERELALQHYREDLAIREALVARDPRDQSIKNDLYVALSYVSRANEDRGDLDQAVSYARRAFDIASSTAAGDPRNAAWQRDLAAAENRLGNVLRWRGESNEAVSRLSDARRILQAIVAAAPTDLLARVDLAAAEVRLGWMALQRNSPYDAAALAEDVARVLTAVLARKSEVEAVIYAADAKLLRGAVAERARDAATATQLREGALALVGPAAMPIRDSRAIAIEARALLALGRRDEASPLITPLIASGYRHPALMTDWRAHGAPVTHP